MSDYSSLGSFSTGTASSLNGELVQKLYDTEYEAIAKPLETSLELIETESTVISDIQAKVNELLEKVKPFDLFSTGNNAFEQVSASATGESALFDAADITGLKPGTTNVTISQLAQKDSYQSMKFLSKTDLIADGQDVGDQITINGSDFSTVGKTYEDLLTEINLSGTIDASIEQVSDDEYRLVIKSQEPGISNTLNITQTGVDLGFDEASNHVLTAQNLNATVNGVDYDISSNSITIDGNLKITASKIGDSSVSIQADDSQIIPAIQEMTNTYNELLLMVTEELNSDEASVQNTSQLKTLLSDIKNMFFETYGPDDESLLSYGISFDKTGVISIDASDLGKALTADPEKAKSLFIGVAEDKGFGTLLKEHIDTLNTFKEGLFDTLTDNVATRKTDLEEEKKKTVATLDTKYDAMAAQFAAYGAIISQMDSSFGALKQMIDSENSSN